MGRRGPAGPQFPDCLRGVVLSPLWSCGRLPAVGQVRARVRCVCWGLSVVFSRVPVPGCNPPLPHAKRRSALLRYVPGVRDVPQEACWFRGLCTCDRVMYVFFPRLTSLSSFCSLSQVRLPLSLGVCFVSGSVCCFVPFGPGLARANGLQELRSPHKSSTAFLRGCNYDRLSLNAEQGAARSCRTVLRLGRIGRSKSALRSLMWRARASPRGILPGIVSRFATMSKGALAATPLDDPSVAFSGPSTTPPPPPLPPANSGPQRVGSVAPVAPMFIQIRFLRGQVRPSFAHPFLRASCCSSVGYSTEITQTKMQRHKEH